MEEEFQPSFTKSKAFVREGPAKGYWVISVRIIDDGRYFTYLELASDAIDRLGGRIVIRSPKVIVGSGSPKPRLVVVEFMSLADAQAAFVDIAQQSAMLMYDGIAEYDLAIVEGYDDFG
ncbi:DUF1330 domain-containing protein [Tabrizicola sp.]|uniref:DUF1330 domain-containing protein n=1 Tax=Tabrizicola sp. TaxID=2005166 RepID=UPI00286B18D2|nr:DUF1330 domain-containing protein [Tabrizicola sp.]